MSSNSYTPTLLDYQALELMNEMKAARYLLETPCDLTASTGIYSNPVDGWNKCKHTVFIVQDTFYIAVTGFEDEMKLVPIAFDMLKPKMMQFYYSKKDV